MPSPGTIPDYTIYLLALVRHTSAIVKAVNQLQCLSWCRATGEAKQLAAVQTRAGLLERGHSPLGQMSLRSRRPDPGLDPCIDGDVDSYLNRRDVQIAMHANTTGANSVHLAVGGGWSRLTQHMGAKL